MRFISDIGRPWTLGEMSLAFMLRRDRYKVGYIALVLNRSVKEIEVVLT